MEMAWSTTLFRSNVVVRNASRPEMLKLFTKIFDGSQLTLKFVEYHQVRTFAIESWRGLRPQPNHSRGERQGNFRALWRGMCPGPKAKNVKALGIALGEMNRDTNSPNGAK